VLSCPCGPQPRSSACIGARLSGSSDRSSTGSARAAGQRAGGGRLPALTRASGDAAGSPHDARVLAATKVASVLYVGETVDAIVVPDGVRWQPNSALDGPAICAPHAQTSPASRRCGRNAVCNALIHAQLPDHPTQLTCRTDHMLTGATAASAGYGSVPAATAVPVAQPAAARVSSSLHGVDVHHRCPVLSPLTRPLCRRRQRRASGMAQLPEALSRYSTLTVHNSRSQMLSQYATPLMRSTQNES